MRVWVCTCVRVRVRASVHVRVCVAGTWFRFRLCVRFAFFDACSKSLFLKRLDLVEMQNTRKLFDSLLTMRDERPTYAHVCECIFCSRRDPCFKRKFIPSMKNFERRKSRPASCDVVQVACFQHVHCRPGEASSSSCLEAASCGPWSSSSCASASRPGAAAHSEPSSSFTSPTAAKGSTLSQIVHKLSMATVSTQLPVIFSESASLGFVCPIWDDMLIWRCYPRDSLCESFKFLDFLLRNSGS